MLGEAWQSIVGGLRRDLGAQIFGQWIRPIKLGSFNSDEGTLELLLPSDFSAKWVRDHYVDRLSLAWKSVIPEVRTLAIRSQPNGAQIHRLRPVEDAAPIERDSAAAQDSALDPRYTFANFVKAQANVLAFTAAERMAA